MNGPISRLGRLAPAADARPIVWLHPRHDQARILARAADGSGGAFELCAAGDVWVLRRLTYVGGRLREVHESPDSVRPVAEQLWADLLAGRAR